MALLETRGLTVRFGGHVAVNKLDLDAEAGAITGLIGPNGAGKTTTFNAITGLQDPTAGRVSLDGRDITRTRPFQRARLGIARTFQRLEVFSSLSVRDNVVVAAEIRRRWSGDHGAEPRRDADELLARVGLTELAEEPADALPTGLARLLELARALATRPKALLLDEPASGLTDSETESLSTLLRSLAADDRIAVLIVEHDMAVVMEVCTMIYVLDFGSLLASGTPTEVQQNERVLAAYLGAPVGAASPSVGGVE